jgi:hypothetical protein
MNTRLIKVLGVLLATMPLLPSHDAAAEPGQAIIAERHRRQDANTVRFSCVAGQLVRIDVTSDGDSEVQAYLFDSNGNLVTADEPVDGVILFHAYWGGDFTVRVLGGRATVTVE